MNNLAPNSVIEDYAAELLGMGENLIKQAAIDERESVVTVRHLRKVYGGVAVVNGVSFEVKKGEIFGLLGPNGAGKTTTVEIIEGLRQADGGEVSLLGMNGLSHSAQVKEKIGIQLQIPSLLPLLTVEEIIRLFGQVYKRPLPVNELLALLSLEESRRVLSKNLSGGQQQRLSVAMALVNDPEIAFLDEPSTGLDPQNRRNLWGVIEEMKQRGKTIFLTTHFMEEAELLCDRLAIMDHGKIIAMGKPQELIDTCFQQSAIEFEAEAPVDLDLLRGLPGVTQAMAEGSQVMVYSDDISATMSAVLKYAENNCLNRKLKSLRVRQSTLEDVFLKLTGRRIRN